MMPRVAVEYPCRSGVRRLAEVLLSLAVLLAAPAAAQDSHVTLDGTLPGTELEVLQGPEYQLGVGEGYLSGDNLFFSFLHFSLLQGESANFDGPASVRNVLGRVTGPGASLINGTLRSNIDGASVYLMNPNGIVFGPAAELDVNGAFHATTADVLTFGDGGEFHASFPAMDSGLAMAEVSAFGFLTDRPAPIQVLGSQLRTGIVSAFGGASLVDAGQPFALIGGDIEILGGDEGYIATGGARLDLVAIGGPAVVELVPAAGEMPGDVKITTDAPLGDIRLAEGAQLITGGGRPGAPANFVLGSGDVFVRANDLTLDDAVIRSITTTGRAGGRIDVELEGDLFARAVGGFAAGLVAGSGLVIGDRDAPFDSRTGQTRPFPLPDGNSQIREFLDADGNVVRYEHSGALPGPGGTIAVTARNITLEDGARFSSSGFFRGDGGRIEVNASETVTLSGIEADGDGGGFFANAQGGGDAGTIDVDAGELRILDGAGIFTEVREGAGTGGDIEVDAARIVLLEGARIDSSTRGSGSGGSVRVTATESLLVSGDPADREASGIQTFSFEEASGNAGTVAVSAPLLRVEDGAVIATSSFSTGDAGDIDIQGNQIELHDSRIAASADNAAGGNIYINGGPIVTEPDGSLTIEKPDDALPGELLLLDRSEITTSVAGGDEGGGDIAIDPEFVVLRQSRIRAEAVGGPGGNIAIVAGSFVSDLESIISASSAFSTSGTVEISTSSPDLRGDLSRLPADIPDVVSLLRERCAARRGGGGASFVLSGRDGMPVSPEDFLPAYHRFEAAQSHEIAGMLLAQESESEPVGLLLGCRATSG